MDSRALTFRSVPFKRTATVNCVKTFKLQFDALQIDLIGSITGAAAIELS